MYLGESSKAIPKEHDIYLLDYDEAMCGDDAILWQRTMKVELESTYSKKVWDLIKALKVIKLVGCE